MKYDFTPFYTLVDKQGEPLYEKALPLFDKLISHLAYILLWTAFIHFFPLLSYPLISLIFIHLFFFGCRLTTLLILGGLIPILFPPLPIRINRKLRKHPSLETLKKYQLDTHPGLLLNLALIQNSRNIDPHEALTLARKHDPSNPIILNFCEILPPAILPTSPARVVEW